MFMNLPRHVFGRLQSKLFPAYFKFLLINIGIALAQDAYGQHVAYHSGNTYVAFMSFAQFCNLAAVFTLLSINAFVFEPWTTSVMFERHVLEKKLGTGHEVGQLKSGNPKIDENPELRALSKRFGMLHGFSTSANLFCLGLGVWHLVWIASKIVK